MGLDDVDATDLADVLLVNFPLDEARAIGECNQEGAISYTRFSGYVSQEGVAMPVLSAGYEVVEEALPRFDLIGVGSGGLLYSDIERFVDWLQAISPDSIIVAESGFGEAFAVRAGCRVIGFHRLVLRRHCYDLGGVRMLGGTGRRVN